MFGITVLASVFSSVGSYASPATFAHGLDAAVWAGAGIVAAAAVAAVIIPRRRTRRAVPVPAEALATTSAEQLPAPR